MSSAPVQAAGGPPVALLDGGSFVLQYDHGLARALVDGGRPVAFFGSLTRYNAVFLEALRGMAGVRVAARPVSGTVSPRWRGVLAYASLLMAVWRQRRDLACVNLQFSVLWPLELPLLWLLRRQLVLTVHNAVPHGYRGLRHRPTAWLASLARRLVFISEATRDDYLRRYGPAHAAKAVVLPHGTLPLAPGLPAVPYRPLAAPQALVFWGSVRPYKGVDLVLSLARSPEWRARGLPLEVHGAWAPELHAERDELRRLGVHVVDGFLDAQALQALLSRPVLFLLPYVGASQSGAMYTLLHHGRHWVCTDVGDLGAFMRQHALQPLLLADRSAAAVLACVDALRTRAAALAAAYAAAQDSLQWDRLREPLARAYGPFNDEIRAAA